MEEAVVHDNMLVVMMLSSDNHGWYGILKDELANHYTMGTDNYPTNMDDCMWFLNNWKSEKNNHTSYAVNK